MSIQSALVTAASSLDMQQQQANVIAGNIANANTPGYGARTMPQLEQVSGAGAGVMAGPLQRLSDEAAAIAANQTSGQKSYSQAMVDSLTTYTQTIGQAADGTSLPSQLSAFSQALTTLSATPDSAALQNGAVTAAQNLVGTFHTMASAVATGREQADQAIESGVTTVNQTLDQLAQNESAMQSAAARGESTASYLDTRGTLLSTLSQQVPIKVFQNSNNSIIVTSDQGTPLWDGTEHKLSFSPTANIPPQMQLTADPANGYSGGLSAVTVDGQTLASSQSGTIAANLQLRDVTLPAYGRQLDQMASNTIAAFQQADPTVTSGETGLFTAGGAAVDPTSTTATPGMAANIAVNAAVDPTQGGQAWRVRDGVQAATQSTATGDNSTVLAFVQAMNTSQTYDTKTGLPGSMTLTDAASQTAGLPQSALSTWTANNTSRTQQAQDAQTAYSNATGVDVDTELQRLLTVQATYAATTQVIQAAAKMLDELNQL